MKTKLTLILGTAAFGLFLGAAVTGCGGSGSTDGGDGDGGGPVLGGGATSGSISLSVVESQIAVASTSGFIVSLTDANGNAGAPGTRITCDSEDGVAIIEPSSGSESTGTGGEVSGRVGCEAPGSYQLVCRLPGTGSRSAAATVICTGNAPIGFTGFPGAGGGGLGGGDGDGVTDFDPTKLRITAVSFRDAGADVNGTIDTIADIDCDTETDGNQPEPFTDAFVSFKVSNNSGQTVNVTSFRYNVPDFPTTADFDSSVIAFTGDNGLTIENGKSGDLSGFFARANSGVKNFIGSSTAVGLLGFRNITFTVSGVTDDGTEVELTATAGANLQNYNNCAG